MGFCVDRRVGLYYSELFFGVWRMVTAILYLLELEKKNAQYLLRGEERFERFE